MLEVESTAKSIGAAPTTDYMDGSPKYTVPIIHDSTTGRVVSDSFKIAEYLDETYPDTPRIIPAGTRMLQLSFCTSVYANVVPILPIIRPLTAANFGLPPDVEEMLKKVYGEDATKVALTVEEQEEAWKKTVHGFKLMAQGFENGTQDDSAFVMGGANLTYADMFTSGFLWWMKLVFGNTQRWKDVASLGDGKLGRLLEETLTLCAMSA